MLFSHVASKSYRYIYMAFQQNNALSIDVMGNSLVVVVVFIQGQGVISNCFHYLIKKYCFKSSTVLLIKL